MKKKKNNLYQNKNYLFSEYIESNEEKSEKSGLSRSRPVRWSFFSQRCDRNIFFQGTIAINGFFNGHATF